MPLRCSLVFVHEKGCSPSRTLARMRKTVPGAHKRTAHAVFRMLLTRVSVHVRERTFRFVYVHILNIHARALKLARSFSSFAVAICENVRVILCMNMYICLWCFGSSAHVSRARVHVSTVSLHSKAQTTGSSITACACTTHELDLLTSSIRSSTRRRDDYTTCACIHTHTQTFTRRFSQTTPPAPPPPKPPGPRFFQPRRILSTPRCDDNTNPHGNTTVNERASYLHPQRWRSLTAAQIRITETEEHPQPPANTSENGHIINIHTQKR